MTVRQTAQGKVRPDPTLMGVYLNDHLAGATGGTELAHRVAASQRSSPDAETLEQLADDIAEDRAALIEIMGTLGIPLRRYKVYAGWAAEKVGRLKLNGQVRGRSPLSDLLELESLCMGVEGKGAMWRVLRILADIEHRLDSQRLDVLIERAKAQSRTLEELHRAAAPRAFVRP